MKKILVIVDMQNDFLTGVLGNSECEATVPEVVKVVKTGEYDYIFLTRDTHGENYLNTQEGKKLPVEHCLKGTEGWEVNAEVTAAVKESGVPYAYVDKPTFGSVVLGNLLKEKCEELGAETEINFVGVCTGICVISNVMIAKGNLPETPVKVIEKACACVTPQSHTTALEAMKTCQVDVI